MAENLILTEEEKTLIEASAPYQEFVKAFPEAGIEDFIKARVESSRAFGIAKKYNKKLEAPAYFANLKEIQRKQFLSEWTAADAAPITALKTAPKVVESDAVPADNKAVRPEEQSESVTEQAKTEAEEKETIIEVPQSIKIVTEAQDIKPKAKENNHATEIKSDRRINFKTDNTFNAFTDNLPTFKEEFEAASLESLDKDSEEYARNLAKRQKIVDYMRFMESGKKSREAIAEGDWKFLEREYQNFPKVPTPVLMMIYNGHLEKNGKEKVARTEMLQRIITYRFEDIQSGKWRISNDDELKEIESFLSTESERNPKFAESAAMLVKDAIESYKTRKAEREAQILKRREELAAAKEAEKLKKQIEADTSKKATAEEKEDATAKPEEIIKEEKEVPHKKTETIKEDVVVTISQAPKTILTELQDTKIEEPLIADKNPISEITDSNKPELKTEFPAEKQTGAEKYLSSWENETEKSWLDYGEKNGKKVNVAKEPGKVTVKLFEDEEKVKAQSPETQIVYDGPDKINVSGRGDTIPDLSIFENIVAQAKKVSSKIRFGEIEDDEFSAKLMIACLRDPQIKMVNAPKAEDFKNLNPELKEILDAELEKSGLIESSSKGWDKSRIARDKINQRDDDRQDGGRRNQYHDNKNRERRPYSDNGRPRREYTKEETEAYLKRKAMREAQALQNN